MPLQAFCVFVGVCLGARCSMYMPMSQLATSSLFHVLTTTFGRSKGSFSDPSQTPHFTVPDRLLEGPPVDEIRNRNLSLTTAAFGPKHIVECIELWRKGPNETLRLLRACAGDRTSPPESYV